MLQCKCGISAPRVDPVCAFCYSNNGLVIKQHTHTHKTSSFTSWELFFSRIFFFSASKISQFHRLNLRFTSLDYCCTTPDCLRAPVSHSSLTETLNRTVHCPPASPHLPHSICLTLFFSEGGLKVAPFRSRSNGISIKKSSDWTLSPCLHLILGARSAHSHRTGLSFPLTDRDNPLSSATSAFPQSPWLGFQKAS